MDQLCGRKRAHTTWDCDFAGLRKTSFARPSASELRWGSPQPDRVVFNLANFLHNQSSVGICTETLTELES